MKGLLNSKWILYLKIYLVLKKLKDIYVFFYVIVIVIASKVIWI